MSSDNLAYRGAKPRRPDRFAILEQARAARASRAPRRSREYYKENDAPWASSVCKESNCIDRNSKSSVTYFFRAHKVPSSSSSSPSSSSAAAALPLSPSKLGTRVSEGVQDVVSR